MKAPVKAPTQRKDEKFASLIAIEESLENGGDNTELFEKKAELYINIDRIKKTNKLSGNEVIDSCFNLVKASNCLFCKKTHKNAQCPKYNTADTKKKRAKELKFCFKCLKRDHKTKNCKTKL